jgi:hypothetical protein
LTRRDLLLRVRRAQNCSRLDLALKLARRPALLDRGEDVELARFLRLGLSEDDEVMDPRQLSQQ